ncbi:hypothetical protein [Solirubrobacter pauli]|nr:hypothetical protein [Solirubrobacter pauli]
MPHRIVVALVVLLVVGCGEAKPVRHVTAPAKDPDLFLDDPQGQVERIAAGGRLVAWSVRTPADRVAINRDEVGELPPLTMPKTSQVMVADERGGARLTVELGHRWVSRLRMLRGPGGPAEPQLAITSCPERDVSSCRDELLTLTPGAPLKVTRRTRGAQAAAAAAGTVDRGRRVRPVGKTRGRCAVRLRVDQPDGRSRTLPRLPARDRRYERCGGLVGWAIAGDHVYATVDREDPEYDFTADFVYAIDFTAPATARWREIARPYRYTPGSYALALGPAITDEGQYWLDLDTERERPENACAIAATDTRVYRLDNTRCATFYGDAPGGAIRISRGEASFFPARP